MVEREEVEATEGTTSTPGWNALDRYCPLPSPILPVPTSSQTCTHLGGMREETSSTGPDGGTPLPKQVCLTEKGTLQTQLKCSPHQREASAPPPHHLVAHCNCSPTPRSLCPNCLTLDHRLECPLLHSHALPVSLRMTAPLECRCAPPPPHRQANLLQVDGTTV